MLCLCQNLLNLFAIKKLVITKTQTRLLQTLRPSVYVRYNRDIVVSVKVYVVKISIRFDC